MEKYLQNKRHEFDESEKRDRRRSDWARSENCAPSQNCTINPILSNPLYSGNFFPFSFSPLGDLFSFIIERGGGGVSVGFLGFMRSTVYRLNP